MSISKVLIKLLSKSKNPPVKFDFNDTLGDESGLICPNGCGEPVNWCSCDKQTKVIKELYKNDKK